MFQSGAESVTEQACLEKSAGERRNLNGDNIDDYRIPQVPFPRAPTHGSDISIAGVAMHPRSLGEQVVNVTSVPFLRVLTIWCPEAEL